jgi:hypothetical protein
MGQCGQFISLFISLLGMFLAGTAHFQSEMQVALPPLPPFCSS